MQNPDDAEGDQEDERVTHDGHSSRGDEGGANGQTCAWAITPDRLQRYALKGEDQELGEEDNRDKTEGDPHVEAESGRVITHTCVKGKAGNSNHPKGGVVNELQCHKMLEEGDQHGRRESESVQASSQGYNLETQVKHAH